MDKENIFLELPIAEEKESKHCQFSIFLLGHGHDRFKAFLDGFNVENCQGHCEG